MAKIPSCHALQPSQRRYVSVLVATGNEMTSVYRHCVGSAEAVIQDQPRCTLNETLIEITNVLKTLASRVC